MGDTDTQRQHVHVEITNEIGTITIDRPERRNALNLAIKRDVVHALQQLGTDSAVRIIVITGTCDYFVAGTDIGEMLDMSPDDHAARGTNDIFQMMRASDKVMIAAVEGYALGGGCELALCCDMIIAGESALFGQPEIRVGIMPGGGGTQAFVRAMGRHRAMKLLLTGEPISAVQALKLGIISEVVPTGSAHQEAIALAQTIVAMPPLAIAGIRTLVQHGPDMPICDALALERQTFVSLFDSSDQKEGMRAFLEKRTPKFNGH